MPLDKDFLMSMPTKARTALRFALLAGAAVLGACSSEVTSPKATPLHVNEATSMFVPSASAKALIGVADGTYAVTFNPGQDQQFYLGPNHLSLPANSVCNLLTSGYGAAYWDASCTPQTGYMTLTVVIKNAASSNPSIQFFPAMRFNPTKLVQLFMYAPNVSRNDAKNWTMLYCTDLNVCSDESDKDKSLTTSIDYDHNVLFRRVKHFSGYTVAERSDSLTTP